MQKAAEELQKDPDGRGLIFGGSGQGEAMTANRYPGIRAVVYYGDGIRVHNGKIYDIIALSREHNNANVLSIGARFVDQDKIFLVVNQWLEAAFSNDERHVRRINKIDRINEVDMPG
jgi:ribose 5-phosphate isomerase B